MSAQSDPVARGIEMKRLREAAGLRQRDVAERLGGLSPQAVSTWESGTSSPELHRLGPIDELYDANGKVLRLYGVPVTSARRDEIRRLRAVVAAQGQAILRLAAVVERLPGVEPAQRVELEQIRSVVGAG